MSVSRRDFLKVSGALIVSFGAESLAGPLALAQGPFDTHPSHIDPTKLDSWIAVAADGMVTAYTGKCDFGQGIFTAQTQLVAEELCVPISRVKLIQCDTSVAPDQGRLREVNRRLRISTPAILARRRQRRGKHS